MVSGWSARKLPTGPVIKTLTMPPVQASDVRRLTSHAYWAGTGKEWTSVLRASRSSTRSPAFQIAPD